MSYNDSFEYSPFNEEDQSWQSALVDTAGALLLLLLGFVGNGVVWFYSTLTLTLTLTFWGMKNIILSRGISDLMNRMMFFFVCSFSVPSSAWLLFLFFAHFFLFIGAQALRGVFQFLSILPSFISVCKGTKNINTFLKNSKKLHHFNIRLYGILTFRRASMCDIAMVDE